MKHYIGLGITLVAGYPLLLNAAGFGTKTEAPITLGQGYGGATAGNGGVESQFYNPANLANLSGRQMQLGLNIVHAKSNANNATATTALSTPVSGVTDPERNTSPKILPNLFAGYQINKDITAGISITSPWGLPTNYDLEWQGRYQGNTSSIKSLNINPSIAHKLNNQLAIGAGVQVQYLDTRLTQAVDCGTIDAAYFSGSLGLSPGTISSDCHSDVQGDDWALGYTLGIHYEPVSGTKLGLGYRSAIDHELKGDVKYDYPNATLATVLPNADVSAGLKTPAMLTAGWSQDINDRLNLGLDLHWTFWSSIDTVVIDFDSTQANATESFNWHDTIFVGLGGSYKLTHQWTLRSGLSYDQSPVKDSLRNVRLPGSDRYWVNVGSSYQLNNAIALHGTYAYGFMDDDNDVNVSNTNGSANAQYDDPYFQVLALQATISF